MEFKEFFKDFKKGILKDEFRYERRDEFQKWIRENTFKDNSKIYGPGDFAREHIKRQNPARPA